MLHVLTQFRFMTQGIRLNTKLSSSPPLLLFRLLFIDPTSPIEHSPTTVLDIMAAALSLFGRQYQDQAIQWEARRRGDPRLAGLSKSV